MVAVLSALRKADEKKLLELLFLAEVVSPLCMWSDGHAAF